jgi:NSS family neurotransmitter:Na+ symporter
MVTVPFKFVSLTALIVFFVGLNKSDGGKGLGYYLGGEKFPVGNLDDGSVVYYDPSLARPEIIQDAYLHVLYSVGLGVGVFFAYGSYNHIKQPVIANSIIICLLDFIFSILAGMVGWGAIGYLQAKGNTAALQTSSVGLGFIAFPEATSLDPEKNGKGWFTFLMFSLFIASIDSAFSYVESVVTNIIDEFKIGRVAASASVCMIGIVLSLFFTSNFGWVFFDLCDHYITSYIVLGAALMQCVSVGWVFERESTAKMSPAH